MSEENTGLCPTCVNSIFCPTFGEYKCKKFERRIYGYKKLTECKFYGKRDSYFKNPKCQCADCLKNPELGFVKED